MTSPNTGMEQALAKAESLGTIGSPSTTTEIKMNILGAAAENKIVGEYAIFKYRQQNANQFALGQITEVRLRNRMLEDHTILTLARSRGQVDHVSDQQDTHEGDLRVSAAYQQTPTGYQQSSMGTVPRTGTDIKKATNELVDEIIQEHANNVFYLGTAYQSDLDLPMWFRQFNGAPGQLAEAHHIGIFGRTGSGKSTLAKLILLAYATHPEMGILIIDPQGEFAKSLTGQPEHFELNMSQRLQEMGRTIINIDVGNIVLARWALVQEILAESRFISNIGIHRRGNPDAPNNAAEIIRNALEGKYTMPNLHTREAFEFAWKAISDAVSGLDIYSGTPAAQRVENTMSRVDQDVIYKREWLPMMNLFNERRIGARRTDGVINDILSNNPTTKPIVNINLDSGNQHTAGIQWNDHVRNIIINQILGELELAAETAYQGNWSLNTMVVIDEAHRLAPSTDPGEQYASRIRARLADSARTTRKYGLGWMFISQSLANLYTDIIRQTRIQFFGQGLSMGSELNSLRDLVPGDSHNINLYQSFKDPESAFSAASREYSFMAAGPVSPLCLTATPIFLSVYNNPQTFLQKNHHKFPNAQPKLTP